MKKLNQILVFTFMLISMTGLLFHSSAQNKVETQVKVSYDFTNAKNAVLTNGPAFGVSWLMENKFINTFDFAVGKNKQLNSEERFAPVNKSITLRYEFDFVPVHFKNFKPSIGFGIENSYWGKKQFTMQTALIPKFQYNLSQKYFVELTVPYYFYQANYGNNLQYLDMGRFTTYTGYDFYMKRRTSIRVGLGVNL